MTKKMMRFTVMALMAAGMFMLGGCSDPIEEDLSFKASALVGTWSNEVAGVIEGDNVRIFTIYPDGSFSATLNPGGGEPGTVNGKLIPDGDGYIMDEMREITGQTWGPAVSAYDKNFALIELSNNNNTFTLDSDNGAVRQFFGGTYHRQQ